MIMKMMEAEFHIADLKKEWGSRPDGMVNDADSDGFLVGFEQVGLVDRKCTSSCEPLPT
jgi:hypothetical protein